MIDWSSHKFVCMTDGWTNGRGGSTYLLTWKKERTYPFQEDLKDSKPLPVQLSL